MAITLHFSAFLVGLKSEARSSFTAAIRFLLAGEQRKSQRREVQLAAA
jgi:hypothetical protein